MPPSISLEQAYRYCPACAAANTQPGSIPFRCTKCGFACFFGPVAAVGGLIVDEARRLLMVRRARDPGKGKWGLPGGFVDRGETVEQALMREVLEETSLLVTEANFLMSYPNQYNYRDVVAPVIDLFYVCRVSAPDALDIAQDELEHFEWTEVTRHHLDNIAFYSNRVAIERWLEGESSAGGRSASGTKGS